MKRLLILAPVIILLAGCGKPKIDASSDEALEKSSKEIAETLNPEDRMKFTRALMLFAFDGAFSEGVSLKNRIDGKTAQEVIAEAEELRREQKEREMVQIREEIKELETKKSRADESKESLTRFVVERSRFSFQDGVLGAEPVMELSVRNNTDQPVSRAYFRGTLQSPGRSIPWVQDEFSYSISGGLEPGESAEWGLVPNRFGEWGRAPKDRDDMVLTVEVLRLDGADGEPLWDSQFSESDQRRLETLRESLSE